MALSPLLLEILRCPHCLSTLREKETRLVCTCAECRRAYDVEDDIPIMLVDRATVLDDDTWRNLQQ